MNKIYSAKYHHYSQHGSKSPVFITRAVHSKKYTQNRKIQRETAIGGIHSNAKVPRNQENYLAYNFPRRRYNLPQFGVSRKTSEYHPCLHLIGSFPHRLTAIHPDNHDTDSRVWPPLR